MRLMVEDTRNPNRAVKMELSTNIISQGDAHLLE